VAILLYVLQTEEDWSRHKEILAYTGNPDIPAHIQFHKKFPEHYPCIAIRHFTSERWYDLDFIYPEDFNRKDSYFMCGSGKWKTDTTKI
jgi:hypothetical protein